MSISVNDNGTWRTQKLIYANDAGTWRAAKAVYIKDSGVWRTVYGDQSGTDTFTTPSTFNWTVPEGVFSITVTGCGGGGAGGSGDGGANNDGPGFGGGGANLVTETLAVSPGDVLTVTVGAGGLGRLGGGYAGKPTTITGPGVNYNVAGGGGGGAWFGWGGPGEISPGVLDTTNRGGFGFNGANDGSRPTAGTSTNGGADGGRGGNYNQQHGSPGESGKLTIIY